MRLLIEKILLLGGSTQQIAAIEYANSAGYYTVLCDYLHDNTGQVFARKFYCISMMDKEAVAFPSNKYMIINLVDTVSNTQAQSV